MGRICIKAAASVCCAGFRLHRGAAGEGEGGAAGRAAVVGVLHREVEERTGNAGSAAEDYWKYTLRLGKR